MLFEKQQARQPASTEPQFEIVTFPNLGSCMKIINTVQHIVLPPMEIQWIAVSISSGLLKS
jgi:hypothetical protein